MTSGYYCAIFSFCGGGKKQKQKKKKKKDDKKTKAFYDWATTGIPIKKKDDKKTKAFYDWATTGIPVIISAARPALTWCATRDKGVLDHKWPRRTSREKSND